MKHKYIFTKYFVFEVKALENLFNNMASEGWQIDKMTRWMLRFKKRESNQHYSIVLQKTYDKEDPYFQTSETAKLCDFMKDFEYAYVCGYGPLRVFRSDQQQVMLTDMEVDIDDVKRISKKFDKSGILLLVIISSCVVLLPILLLMTSNMRYASELLLGLLANFPRGVFLLLFFVVFLVTKYIAALPLWKFRKCAKLTDDPSLYQWKRFFLAVAPYLCYLILIFVIQGYFLLLYPISIGFCMLLSRRFQNHRNVLTFLSVVIAVLFLVVCLSASHNRKTISPSSTIPFTYQQYSNSTSMLLELERYSIKDDVVAIHYIVKNTYLSNAIQDLIRYAHDLKKDIVVQGSSHSPLFKEQAVYWLSEDNVWILYANDAKEVLRQMKIAYPN